MFVRRYDEWFQVDELDMVVGSILRDQDKGLDSLV